MPYFFSPNRPALCPMPYPAPRNPQLSPRTLAFYAMLFALCPLPFAIQSHSLPINSFQSAIQNLKSAIEYPAPYTFILYPFAFYLLLPVDIFQGAMICTQNPISKNPNDGFSRLDFYYRNYMSSLSGF
jgi:hypothetical protein